MKNLTLISLLLSAAMVAQTKPTTLTVNVPNVARASSIDAPAIPATATPLKFPESLLVEYWHAIAAHWALQAAFYLTASDHEKSLARRGKPFLFSARQNQLRDLIAKVDDDLAEIRKQLAAECGAQTVLDESGAVPVCRPR